MKKVERMDHLQKNYKTERGLSQNKTKRNKRGDQKAELNDNSEIWGGGGGGGLTDDIKHPLPSAFSGGNAFLKLLTDGSRPSLLKGTS